MPTSQSSEPGDTRITISNICSVQGFKMMRFILDRMLGRMRSWLRLFGYDTIYAEEGEEDGTLFLRAKHEGRILLSRDKALVERCRQRGVRAIQIRSLDIVGQLTEVMIHLGVDPSPKMIRCTLCNDQIKRLNKDELEALREEGYDYIPVSPPDDREFWQCTGCGQVFWEGGHWENIRKTEELLRRRYMTAERLRHKLEHWIEHSEGHLESYRKAMEEAGDLGLRDVQDDLKQAVQAMEDATGWLMSALKRLKMEDSRGG
ncbi:MAG TPA: hypothetical protein ENG09_00780 [Candidatus Syntrophoarchaeum butanivorans]|uniref:Uncharacterized protein n=1 Tax=Candidatus Syntropharchaeum butanivorans TaxID=1839936 RepID=A0A7C0WZQ3_9EURY|nr:hypothetical protein [Candidatus Syntrophoarchaeum butanivorans]